MSISLLSTKLYVPHAPANAVSRRRLIEHVNEGLKPRLTLVSASAGSGKSTLVSEWATGCGRPVAWLSLDEGDNDSSAIDAGNSTCNKRLSPLGIPLTEEDGAPRCFHPGIRHHERLKPASANV